VENREEAVKMIKTALSRGSFGVFLLKKCS